MTARLFALLSVTLVGGALLAGCGSSSTTSSSQSSSTSAPSAPASAATSSSSTSTPSTPAGVPSSAAVQEAVAACKSSVHSAPTLSASVKSKIEDICNKAASGNLEAAQKAAKEACTEIVNASPVPASAKEAALAACKSK